jgi:hypothetical protein
MVFKILLPSSVLCGIFLFFIVNFSSNIPCSSFPTLFFSCLQHSHFSLHCTEPTCSRKVLNNYCNSRTNDTVRRTSGSVRSTSGPVCSMSGPISSTSGSVSSMRGSVSGTTGSSGSNSGSVSRESDPAKSTREPWSPQLPAGGS